MRETVSTILFAILLTSFSFSQTNWRSSNYNYSIEIPEGFSKENVVGSNVDFKATRGMSSVVIVVITIPQEYVSYSIWELLGDLDIYQKDWELESEEYLDNPIFLKYGKTILSNLETYWFDYTTDNPKLYSKNYQTKKGNKLYTITLTCPAQDYNYYSSIWFRFKNNMKIDY